jgi:hypothetical protein
MLADLVDGYVSRGCAERDYGVAISELEELQR